MSPNDGSSKCRNYEAFRGVVLWCTGVRARSPFGGAVALRRPSSWLSVISARARQSSCRAWSSSSLRSSVAAYLFSAPFIARTSSDSLSWIGQCIPVLGVLDEEDHQKGDDGRAGIDHELPSVAEVEKRAGNDPDDDNGDRQEKCDGIVQSILSRVGELGKLLAQRWLVLQSSSVRLGCSIMLIHG